MTGWLLLVAGFFAGMGLTALLRPESVLAVVGVERLTVDGRNEVRAVYGGFGVSMAVLIYLARDAPAWGAGALLAVGVALASMAAGRVVSMAVDRKVGRWPVVFGAVELVLAAVLFGAFAGMSGGAD